jgi:hypothetical protein
MPFSINKPSPKWHEQKPLKYVKTFVAKIFYYIKESSREKRNSPFTKDPFSRVEVQIERESQGGRKPSRGASIEQILF